MDLENAKHKKTGKSEYKKFSIDFTNMRQMWQSVTVFINVLGMVHTTKCFIHSPCELTFSLSSQSKFVGPFEFEITRVACIFCWIAYYLSLVTRKPVIALCKQQRPRSACASTQSDQHHCCSLPRQYNTLVIPPTNYVCGGGVYCFHVVRPSVFPSRRLSVRDVLVFL